MLGGGVKLRGIWCPHSARCAAGVRTDLHCPLSSGSLPRVTGEGEWGGPTPPCWSQEEGDKLIFLTRRQSPGFSSHQDSRSGGEGATEDEMVGWHLQPAEQALGDGEGQRSLACYSPWGCRVGHA